jgi:hypothetical protein
MPILTESGTYGPTDEPCSAADYDVHGITALRWRQQTNSLANACAFARYGRNLLLKNSSMMLKNPQRPSCLALKNRER